MSDRPSAPASDQAINARRREMAIGHLLFGTIRFIAHRHPDLLDELNGSLDHLWDKAHGDDRDDAHISCPSYKKAIQNFT